MRKTLAIAVAAALVLALVGAAVAAPRAWATPALPSGAAAQAGTSTPDVVYGHKDGMALTYDVLHPSGTSNGAGVIFMVSGGWVSRWRAPEDWRPRFSDLLDAGFTVFLVRHGSSPRYKVPDAVADVRLAVSHIRSHATDFGVDAGRLGVTGGSAGGHLSLMLGLAAEEIATGSDNRLAAIVAYFPPVDLRPYVGPSERFPALDFGEELAESVSPLLFVSPDDPPTLLIHGDHDELVPLSESERLDEALRAANVDVEFIVIKGAGHGFRGADSERAAGARLAWFEKHLGATGR